MATRVVQWLSRVLAIFVLKGFGTSSMIVPRWTSTRRRPTSSRLTAHNSPNHQHPNDSLLRRKALKLVLSVASTALFPSLSSAEDLVLFLPNGIVRVPDPIALANGQTLKGPKLLGSGGGGSVFGFSDSKTVIKISWLKSTESVERECKILEQLERSNVPGVETCLGAQRYPFDDRRSMIVLEPLQEDNVASVNDIDVQLRPRAVREIARTLVRMLAAGVATVDVQPLISQQTGQVLFVDFTEAITFAVTTSSLSPMEIATIRAFCTEMMALVPEEYSTIALETMSQELRGSANLSNEVREILDAQLELLLAAS